MTNNSKVPVILQGLKLIAAKMKTDDEYSDSHSHCFSKPDAILNIEEKDMFNMSDSDCLDVVFKFVSSINEYHAKMSGHRSRCSVCDN